MPSFSPNTNPISGHASAQLIVKGSSSRVLLPEGPDVLLQLEGGPAWIRFGDATVQAVGSAPGDLRVPANGSMSLRVSGGTASGITHLAAIGSGVINLVGGVGEGGWQGVGPFTVREDGKIVPSGTIDASDRPIQFGLNEDSENLLFSGYSTISGTYTGTGAARGIVLPFEPALILIRGNTAAANSCLRIWTENSWLQRVIVGDPIGHLGDVDVYGQTVTIASGPLTENGVAFHYIAIGDPFGSTIVSRNYQGNWTATDYELIKNLDTAIAIFKRDNLVPPYWATSDGACGTCNGSATAGTIAMQADGILKISSDNAVNGGESNDVIAFRRSPGIDVFRYVGGAITTISTSVSDIEGIILIPVGSGYGYGAHVWFPTDPTNLHPFVTGAAVASTISVSRGRFNINTGAPFNTSGQTYIAIVIGKARNATNFGSRSIRSKFSSTSLLMLGAGAYLDCGTDDSLAISGACTLEWFGQSLITTGVVGAGNLDPNARALFVRATGNYGDPGICSFGMWLAYNPYVMEPPGFWVAAKNKINFPLSTAWQEDLWQTGIRPYERELVHMIARCDEKGNWMVFQNGRLVKERKQKDITSHIGGLKMCIGGMYGTGATPDLTNGIVSFSTIRIYSRPLTDSEISRNVEACAQPRKRTPVPDFVEEWQAKNFSGGTLFASRNPLNNGAMKTNNYKLFLGL